jgi:hypothetical protein
VPSPPINVHQRRQLFHPLICKATNGKDIISRHNSISQALARCLKNCFNLNPTNPNGYDVRVEKTIFTETSSAAEKTRRGDVEIALSEMEKMIFDTKVMCPACPSNIWKNKKLPESDRVTKKGEEEKRTRYRQVLDSTQMKSFIPIVFTSTGKMGNDVQKFFHWMASKSKIYRFEHILAWETKRFFDTVSVVIAKYNSKCIQNFLS